MQHCDLDICGESQANYEKAEKRHLNHTFFNDIGNWQKFELSMSDFSLSVTSAGFVFGSLYFSSWCLILVTYSDVNNDTGAGPSQCLKIWGA